MKRRLSWWRFGGWFSLSSREEVGNTWYRRLGWVGRFQIHPMRIFLDATKSVLVLAAAYHIVLLASPLAITPPPPAYLERYPKKPFVVRDNGDAERVWASLLNEKDDLVCDQNSMGQTELPVLNRLAQALQNEPEPIDWSDETAVPLKALLAEAEPLVHLFAEKCAEADPPGRDPEAHPFGGTPTLSPLIKLVRLLPEMHVQNGDADAYVRAFRSLAAISAHRTRDSSLVGWLVGNLMSERLMRSVVSLDEANLLDNCVAGEIEKTLIQWHRDRGSIARPMAAEGEWSENLIKYYRNYKPEASGTTSADRETEKMSRQIRKWVRYGWLFGISPRSVIKANRNLAERMRIEAEIWADPEVDDPNAVNWTLDDSSLPNRKWGFLFRRGWMAITMLPDFINFHRRPIAMDAELGFAHAVAAIGAYRHKHGELPSSLAAAYEAAGLKPGLPTLYLPRQPDYRVFGQDKGVATETYAFRLSFRGQGGRIPKDGGAAWLVVCNPAFGGRDIQRLWTWAVLKPNQRDGVPPEADLPFPSGLLSAKEDQIDQAIQTLRDAGWN